MKKPIRHLPKRTQEELTVLLDLVCKSVDNCQMTILFGNYARGNYVLWDTKIEFGVHTSYQSDYDILVITNGAVERVERKLERITDKYHDLPGYRRHAFPRFIVEHINTVNNNLEVSQYFFTDIIEEGISLYGSGKCQLAKPRKLNFRETRDIAQNEFGKLFPYACDLLTDVKDCFILKEEYNLPAFMLHQSYEKLYNTISMVFTNYRPKGHRLQGLGGGIKSFSMELVTVFLQNTDSEKKCSDLLCQAHIKARYNKDYKITREQLEYLISRLDILKGVTECSCKEKIAEYNVMAESG